MDWMMTMLELVLLALLINMIKGQLYNFVMIDACKDYVMLTKSGLFVLFLCVD